MLNKKISSLGICMIFILQLCAWMPVAVFAEGDNTYVNETFDELKAQTYSSFPISKGFEGSTYAFPKGAIWRIVDDPSEADKSLQLFITKENAVAANPPNAQHRCVVGDPNDANILMETRLKIDVDFYDEKDNYFSFGPWVDSKTTSKWWSADARVQFFPGNKIKFGGREVGKWTKNKWYDVKLMIQPKTGLCTAYIKGDGEEAVLASYTYAALKNKPGDWVPFQLRGTYAFSNPASIGTVTEAYLKASEYSGWNLLSSDPVNGADNVEVTTDTISLAFDTPMKKSSFENITLTGSSPSGTIPPVPYTIESTDSPTNDNFTSCTLKAGGTLSHDTVYTLDLSGLKDIYGAGPSADVKKYSFNTASKPLGPPKLKIDLASMQFLNGTKDITKTGLTAGDITVSVPLKNEGAAAMNPVMIVGLYKSFDGTDRLIKSAQKIISLESGQTQTVSAALSVSQEELKDSRMIVFVWDDINQILAEYDPVVFTQAGIEAFNPDGGTTDGFAEMSVTYANINQDGQVTVEGFMQHKNRRVSLAAVDANGAYNHFAQTATNIDGAFRFSYYLGAETPDGQYHIYVNGVGAAEKWQSSGLSVNLKSAAPKAFKPEITGEIAVGNTISAEYQYFQASGQKEAESEIQWYTASSKEDAGKPITGATGKTYTVRKEDAGQYIKVSVTPVSVTGARGDTVYSSGALVFEMPVAENVTIKGTCEAGNTISGSYDYLSSLQSVEKGSAYRWLKSDRADGEFIPIVTATSLTYTLRDADIGSYIKFEVTPATEGKDESGAVVELKGNAALSSAMLVKAGSSAEQSSKDKYKAQQIWIDNPYFNKPLPQTDFSDIEGHWAKFNILSAVQSGFMEGLDEHRFEPERDITRSEFVYGVARVLRIYPVAYAGAFYDVSAGVQYSGFIQAAFDSGLVQGDGGYFYPDASISRQEMCAILIRALNKTKAAVTAGDVIQFADRGQISDWAKKDVESAVAYGLLSGVGDDRFAPLENATRAQGAVIFERLNNLVGSPSFTAANQIPSEDAAANPAEEFEKINRNAIITLMNLGIFEKAEEEEIDTTATVRRDEFIKMIMKSTGVEDAAGIWELPYTDVDQKNPNHNFIGAALGAGYINADDAFYPDRGVTMMQAVVMLTKLLGYEEYAMNNGGYPAGYQGVAKRKDLLKGTDFSDDRVLSLGEAAQMLLNSYDQTILQVTALGPQTEYSAKKDETLSKVYLQIERAKGQITANEFTTVTGEGSSLKSGCIAIDGTSMNAGETNAADLIGHMVDYYVKEESEGEYTLLDVTPSSMDRVLTIQSKWIDSYYNLALTYFENGDGKRKEINLSRDIPVLYNGLYWGISNDLTQAQIKPQIGSIEFVDNNGDGKHDLLIIKSYQSVVVGGVDKQNMIVTDKFNASYKLDLNEEGIETHYTVKKYGLKMTVSNLKEWDIILVCDSGNVNGKRMLVIEACTETITDPIDTVDELEKKVTFSGVQYDISPQFKNVSKTNVITANDRGTFYLDSFNNIAAFQGTEAVSDNYAILTAAAPPQEWGEPAQFKLFDSKGEFHILKGAKNIYLNGQTYDSASQDDYAKLNLELKKTALKTDTVVQLVKFERNSDGELLRFYTAVKRAEAKEDSELIQENELETLQAKVITTGYLNFSGKFIWSASTAMFAIPTDVTNDKKYFNPLATNFANDEKVVMTAYNLDLKTGIPDVMLFGEMSAVLDSKSDLLVVEEVAQTLNDDGDSISMISGVYQGEKGSWTVSDADDKVESIAKGLKFGDVARISLDGTKQITNIEATFLMEEHESAPLQMTGTYVGELAYVYGVISGASKDANTVGVSTDLAAAKDFFYFTLKGTRIVVCDTVAETVTVGSIEDLLANANSTRPDARVFLKMNWGVLKDFVIYY